MGYTPYYVTAVWYGYDNNKEPIEIAYGEERTKATQIWTGIMNKIHEGLPPRDFEKPEGIVEREICIYSGKIATNLCKQDPRGSAVMTEHFIRGTEPAYSEVCDVHVRAKVCTDSKDAWGRCHLAGTNCPASSIEERVLIRRLRTREIQIDPALLIGNLDCGNTARSVGRSGIGMPVSASEQRRHIDVCDMCDMVWTCVAGIGGSWRGGGRLDIEYAKCPVAYSYSVSAYLQERIHMRQAAGH